VYLHEFELWQLLAYNLIANYYSKGQLKMNSETVPVNFQQQAELYLATGKKPSPYNPTLQDFTAI